MAEQESKMETVDFFSTLPANLCLKQSRIPDGGYEVWSLKEIPVGVRFGPYQETFIDTNKNDLKDFPWQVDRIDKEFTILDERNEIEPSWLLHVNNAHHEEEQNMITFCTESEVYYITCRSIPANTELLVYNKDNIFGNRIGYEKKETGGTEKTQSNAFSIEQNYKSKHNEMCGDIKDEKQLTATPNNEVTENISQCSSSEGAFSLKERKTQLIFSSIHRSCSNNESIFIHKEYHIEGKYEQSNRTDAFPKCGKPKIQDQECNEDNKLYKNNKNYLCWNRKDLAEGRNSQMNLQSNDGTKYENGFSQPCECNFCGKKFTCGNSLIAHERIHNGMKPFECSVCEKKFNHRSSLRKHKVIHNGEKAFECKDCGKKFNHRSGLREHGIVHTGEKPFECSACGKKFNHRSSLRKHEIIHTGLKPFECNACGKTFNDRSSLRKHERIHTGEKPFQCETCGKRFTQTSSLREHETIHTGEKRFQCNTCGKKFNHRTCLIVHERIHTGEMPFECSDCGKKFRQKSNLREHQVTHAIEGQFENNTCWKKFNNRWYLVVHERIHPGQKS